MFSLILGFFLYFLPAIIAAHRDHPSRISILIFNTCLGWTVIGWFFALFWSLRSYPRVVYVPYGGQVIPPR